MLAQINMIGIMILFLSDGSMRNFNIAFAVKRVADLNQGDLYHELFLVWWFDEKHEQHFSAKTVADLNQGDSYHIFIYCLMLGWEAITMILLQKGHKFKSK